MTMALLIAAFFMGFLGSPHCLGMCGGLVAAFSLSMKDVSAAKRHRLIATYHLGRLISYSILGLVAGIIGVAILQPLMVGNSMPRILLGLVLVFVGITMLGAPFLNKLERLGMRFWQYLAPIRTKVFPLNTYPRALAAGLLWGYLPCGLVYGALLIAVVARDPLSGAALMFVFGLGTVPMLVATHETVGWLRERIGRLRLRQINGSLMIASGMAVILVPIVMANMHSGHNMTAMSNDGTGDHMQMSDSPTMDVNKKGMEMEHTMNDDMTHEDINHKNMDHSNMTHEDMSN